MKKKIFPLACILLLGLSTACSNWMEVLPTNEQVTPRYWQTKEDVESILASAYQNLRSQVSACLIDWSELRASSLVVRSNTTKLKLQNFKMTSDNSLCSWAGMYKVLNLANSVIHYAPEVQKKDETYLQAYVNGHLVEAEFIRALTYFYLVRNFKEVPLVVNPYIDDSEPFSIAKSSEEEIIAQIKADILHALSLDPKEYYDDDEWEGATKGRATKWALYALMADVCLWNGDYADCIDYCDRLIDARSNAKSNFYPAFMDDPDNWFSIFFDGNTNESIFELNWQKQTYDQTSGSPSTLFPISTSSTYLYSVAMSQRLDEEASLVNAQGATSVRAEWGAFAAISSGESQHVVWKYKGYQNAQNTSLVRSYDDANWIIYRMADVLLMKAEALVWSQGDATEALQLINRVRERARLDALTADVDIDPANQLEMLRAVLYERDIEFAAEGKRWYDLMRFGRSLDYKYKSEFINIILENNETESETWVASVLQDPYGWYLPIRESELETNTLLEQNPYYASTSGN